MKFNEFVNEGRKKLPVETIVKELNKNCQPFLKEWIQNNRYLWFMLSGRHHKKDMLRKKIRQDRTPTDTPDWVQEQLDDAFHRKFHVKPRSSSIFTTGEIQTAKSYGINVYMIFPVQNYEVIWSDSIKDLWTHIDDETNILEMMSTQEEGPGYIPDYISDEWDSDARTYLSDEWLRLHGEDGKGHWTYEDELSGRHEEFADGTTKAEAEDELFHQHDTTYNPDAPEPIDNYSVSSVEDWEWTPETDEEDYIDDNILDIIDDKREAYIENLDYEVDNSLQDVVNQYQKGDVVKAIESSKEIMVMGTEYIAVSIEYEKELREWYGRNPRQAIEVNPKQLNLFDWEPGKKRYKEQKHK